MSLRKGVLGLFQIGICFLFVCNSVSANAVEKKSSTLASGQSEDLIKLDVEKYQLDNGMVVLLHEDHSLPMVSYHTWFRVGSKDEEKGYTGIAHLFEHMMFKATKNHKGGEFDKTLQANGATNNAFTSRDYTGYYEIFPSDKLEIMMDLESDRMVNLLVNAENLKSEAEVVKEERRMRVDNSVAGKLSEVVMATVFKGHPYEWPVVGFMEDLNRISVGKCLEFYKNFYAPNNAVLVIAGDIDRKKTKELIKKYYSKLKASNDLKKRVAGTGTQQKKMSFKKIYKDVQNITYSISYKAPKGNSDDAFAMDLLSNILSLGDSSRLHRKVVYKSQLATSVSSYNYTPKDVGVFRVTAAIKPGLNYEKVQKMILGELYRVRNSLVSEEELLKAKNQVMKGYVDSLKTLNGKAYSLALNETIFGDYKIFLKDLKRYSEVTPERIKVAANKYLKKEFANIILVEPRKSSKKKSKGKK